MAQTCPFWARGENETLSNNTFCKGMALKTAINLWPLGEDGLFCIMHWNLTTIDYLHSIHKTPEYFSLVWHFCQHPCKGDLPSKFCWLSGLAVHLEFWLQCGPVQKKRIENSKPKGQSASSRPKEAVSKLRNGNRILKQCNSDLKTFSQHGSNTQIVRSQSLEMVNLTA